MTIAEVERSSHYSIDVNAQQPDSDLALDRIIDLCAQDKSPVNVRGGVVLVEPDNPKFYDRERIEVILSPKIPTYDVRKLNMVFPDWRTIFRDKPTEVVCAAKSGDGFRIPLAGIREKIGSRSKQYGLKNLQGRHIMVRLYPDQSSADTMVQYLETQADFADQGVALFPPSLELMKSFYFEDYVRKIRNGILILGGKSYFNDLAMNIEHGIDVADLVNPKQYSDLISKTDDQLTENKGKYSDTSFRLWKDYTEAELFYYFNIYFPKKIMAVR